jgi:hypothetical protein
MGISKQLFEIYEKLKINKFNSLMKLLELGDQDIVFGNLYGTKLRNLESKNYKKWVSYDLHQRNGVTIKDLSIISDSDEKWDIITNFGTSEHVEPEIGQYNCSKNMHNWLNLNGYIVHEIPEKGSWPNHCRYYTDINFFNEFLKIGYEIIENSMIYYHGNGNLSFAVLKKIKEMDFFDYDYFMSLIYTDKNNTSNVINSENNPKNLIF